MGRTIRRGARARQPFEAQAALRWQLLDRYAADPEFGRALEALARSNQLGPTDVPDWSTLYWEVRFEDERPADWPGAPMAPDQIAYVRAVLAAAERWGLHRLLGPREQQGAHLIDEWCRWRWRHGERFRASSFKSRLGASGPYPDIGEVVSHEEWDLGDVRVIDEEARPLVHVDLTDRWDPRAEARGVARQRIERRAREQISAELDRLAADAEAKGYRFMDTAPNEVRDLDWLFALMTGRASAMTLAQSLANDDDLEPLARVGQALRRIARRAGISTRGWKLPRE